MAKKEEYHGRFESLSANQKFDITYFLAFKPSF